MKGGIWFQFLHDVNKKLGTLANIFWSCPVQCSMSCKQGMGNAHICLMTLAYVNLCYWLYVLVAINVSYLDPVYWSQKKKGGRETGHLHYSVYHILQLLPICLFCGVDCGMHKCHVSGVRFCLCFCYLRSALFSFFYPSFLLVFECYLHFPNFLPFFVVCFDYVTTGCKSNLKGLWSR